MFSENIDETKYLGSGTKNKFTPQLTSHQKLVEFAQSQLFRIPTNPRAKKRAKEAERPKAIPTWVTKRFLLQSFRDLALVDRAFAEAITPTFQELALYKGVMVRELAISSLAHIERKYQDTPIENLTFLAKQDELYAQSIQTDTPQ